MLQIIFVTMFILALGALVLEFIAPNYKTKVIYDFCKIECKNHK